ncbi:hypothetical protein ACVWY3_000330 [Bradyrhizobium sp. USDA 4486]
MIAGSPEGADEELGGQSRQHSGRGPVKPESTTEKPEEFRRRVEDLRSKIP